MRTLKSLIDYDLIASFRLFSSSSDAVPAASEQTVEVWLVIDHSGEKYPRDQWQYRTLVETTTAKKLGIEGKLISKYCNNKIPFCIVQYGVCPEDVEILSDSWLLVHKRFFKNFELLSNGLFVSQYLDHVKSVKKNLELEVLNLTQIQQKLEEINNG